jgi:hypothetical protein
VASKTSAGSGPTTEGGSLKSAANGQQRHAQLDAAAAPTLGQAVQKGEENGSVQTGNDGPYVQHNITDASDDQFEDA